ncbi:hypothetical protein NA57DRAFT_71136 [Rhizodiscina lignyota]|uniref:Uncharacterized protein n=1 Tax=Rhizodiscina lignyota TaxID=1504668 RepID=A0A9P4MEY8_9PEZI|nr:hypothetical protein NA57DRAFT_71136 [Rhizodiscina lignyota]
MSSNDQPTQGYVPPPSTGHEIGVMFGFIGAMILSMVLYGVVWQRVTKRNAEKERRRVAAFNEKGWLKAVPGMEGDEAVEKHENVLN